jgi:hypothetical protein
MLLLPATRLFHCYLKAESLRSDVAPSPCSHDTRGTSFGDFESRRWESTSKDSELKRYCYCSVEISIDSG